MAKKETVRLPLNYQVEAEGFKVNQYYTLEKVENGKATIYQGFYKYRLEVDVDLIIKVM